MVLFPEHRYYGESVPFGSREVAYKNASTLSYLTAEQALADFAVLITDLKRNLSAQACPVVLFGGSYGGMLAAWMRLKYPHVAIGALASSAPILQFENIVPPETFYNLVSNDFKRESTSCFNTIKESWDALLSEGLKKNGLVQLTKTFHLCRELKSTEDLADWLDSAYSYLAMVDYPYPSAFMMPLPGYPIREVCKRIDGCPNGTTILERIFEGISVYYNYTGELHCFELDDDPHGLDGWNWQACTEMVMPMSSSHDQSMYPTYDFNYSSFQEGCWEEFGVIPRPRWITTEFGGQKDHFAVSYLLLLVFLNVMYLGGWTWKQMFLRRRIRIYTCVMIGKINAIGVKTSMQVLTTRMPITRAFSTMIRPDIKTALETFGSNIIFSNGLLDPWSGGSVLQNISETIVALVTEEGAHHLDLRPSTPEDPDWLVEQRETEVKLIKGWIDDYLGEKKTAYSM
ncbi:hypothetical protein DKX38_010896 [Salix brachista]|uniref:Serine carboxypeptidase S28 family protein n=1 Tax=Salix brachista TaxID=2182728 RepID=A0A5N5LXT6_9ROSI|nr:hypothetical protein DKX38_010896 [Salix brachista]